MAGYYGLLRNFFNVRPKIHEPKFRGCKILPTEKPMYVTVRRSCAMSHVIVYKVWSKVYGGSSTNLVLDVLRFR